MSSSAIGPHVLLQTWGRNHGVCADCPRTTWYFNYTRYQPEGAGVEFSNGRVDAVFTLWSPAGWRTTKGLRLGDAAMRLNALYGSLPVEHCGTYDAHAFVHARSVTAFYVVGTKLWGFGLMRPSVSVCR